MFSLSYKLNISLHSCAFIRASSLFHARQNRHFYPLSSLLSPDDWAFDKIRRHLADVALSIIFLCRDDRRHKKWSITTNVSPMWQEEGRRRVEGRDVSKVNNNKAETGEQSKYVHSLNPWIFHWPIKSTFLSLKGPVSCSIAKFFYRHE